MGQGIYTAIVWGVILPNTDDSYYDACNSLTEGSEHRSIRRSYERKWFGVIVADSDGNINTRYEPLPENRSNPDDPHEQIGLCFYKKAFKLSEIEQKINEVKPNCIAQAKQDWEAFNLAMKDLGFELPEPSFLLVNDWH
jgi:hypothetical protein